MANPEHLELLQQGPHRWNEWRRAYPAITPDLEGMVSGVADAEKSRWLGPYYFHGSDSSVDDNGKESLVYGRSERVNLEGAQMRGASLIRADLRNTCLRSADLRDANLSRAFLAGVDLRRALLIDANLSNAVMISADLTDATLDRAFAYKCDLTSAVLIRAGLVGTNLRGASLSGANLCEAEMQGSNLSDANLAGANLTGCSVYGLSVWNTNTDGAIQSSLVITREGEPEVQVDNLEVAQFIHLLFNNRGLRGVIDSITSKVVLILGRFTPERKNVLERVRNELRRLKYLPVLFDFEKPLNRDITETVSTLAHLSRFIIADLTDARSIPQELMQIVPALPSVPVQPLLLSSQHAYGMFEHFRRFPWVLEPFVYDNPETLLRSLVSHVIVPAEEKVRQQISYGSTLDSL